MFRQLITEFTTTGHDVLLVLGPFARIMYSGGLCAMVVLMRMNMAVHKIMYT